MEINNVNAIPITVFKDSKIALSKIPERYKKCY